MTTSAPPLAELLVDLESRCPVNLLQLAGLPKGQILSILVLNI